MNAIARSAMRRRLLVLCYHAVISDDVPKDQRANIAVTQSQFELQLCELVRHWTPIAITGLSSAIYEKRPLPSNAVLVTFDDGFRNNIEHAAPILQKYRIPAIFFLTTGLIGTKHLLWTQELVERIVAWPDGSFPRYAPLQTELPCEPSKRLSFAAGVVAHCKRLPNSERTDFMEKLRKHELRIDAKWKQELYDFMSWDDVRELRDRGFEIGSHTVNHPILSSLASDELERQLKESKQKIECEIGRECTCFAYPNGGNLDVSDEVINMAIDTGFRLGFKLCGSLNPSNLKPLEIDRMCVTQDMSLRRFQLHASGLL